MPSRSDALIIGGGVIGVCSAYYLRRAGLSVTLLEQDEIASGASYANAGLVVPGHTIPLANPGVVAQGLRWMLRADSPFYIKPRLDPALISWLYRFWRFSTHAHTRRGLEALSHFGYNSLQLLQDLLAAENLNCDFHQDGWLMAFGRAVAANWGNQGALVKVEKGEKEHELMVTWTRCPWPTYAKDYDVPMEEDVQCCDRILQTLVKDVNTFFNVNYKIETLKAIPRGQGACVRRISKEG